ncbi:MAG: KH domain-containing protein [Oscillospiraceae bacterium]|nr:KH domain-containing protein [Oscillospiraceae bacterium]
MKNINQNYITETHLVDTACNYLVNILKAFGSDDIIIDKKIKEDSIIFDVRGDDVGRIIGKRGSVLDAIQYLINLVVNRDVTKYFKVKINVCEYREKREKALNLLGKKIASRVEKTGEPYKLEAMTAYDRRIIHLAVGDFAGVKSISEGNGVNRHVVVMSADKSL